MPAYSLMSLRDRPSRAPEGWGATIPSTIRGAFSRADVLLGFLFAGWVGFGHAAYLVYPSGGALFYACSLLVYTTGILWIFVSQPVLVHGHKDPSGDLQESALVHRYWLCADPVCDRCRGYYAGLTFALPLTLSLQGSILEVLRFHGVPASLVGAIGSALFLLTTPVAGAVDSIIRRRAGTVRPSTPGRRAVKTVLGLVSGLAIGAVAISIMLATGPR